jgi:predicted permease
MLHDLRYAFRTLRRSPLFSVMVVLSLALGIGANTAIFSMIEALLLKSLPVRNPSALRVVEPVHERGDRQGFSYPLFERTRDDNGVFAGVFACSGTSYMQVTELPIGRESGKVAVEQITGEFFRVLGVDATAGRIIEPADNITGRPSPVAVLSYRFWKVNLAQDAEVLGRTIILDGQPVTIIGIAAPGFFGVEVGESPDLWVPAAMQPLFDRGSSKLDRANTTWLHVMGRLRPGITDGQARANMAVLLGRIQAESGPLGRSMKSTSRFAVQPGGRGISELRARYSQALRIVMAIVGLLLLIACANVANLRLARASARQREIAIRVAIGATRRRLIQQVLTESILLSCAGGALGILFASWSGRVLLLLVSGGDAPVALEWKLDSVVLVFTSGISLLSGALFGLLPALAATKQNTNPALKAPAGGRGLWLRPLVILQVAVSLLLTIGASLFVRTLQNLRSLDLGFAPRHLVQARISPASSGYSPEQMTGLYRRIAERLRSIPGVLSVAMAGSGFRNGTSQTCCLAVEGLEARLTEDRRIITNSVTADYFTTMGIPLLAGRGFTSADIVGWREREKAAIVNESFARYYFGAVNGVGRRIGWGDPPKVRYGIEIIGVVKDSTFGDLRSGTNRMIYFPAQGGDVIEARVGGDPATLISPIRAAIQREDAGLRILDLAAMARLVESSMSRERLVARLASFFGALALMLSALGLYGVLSYGVVRRKQEIGVRMALGAHPFRVIAMVLREAMMLVVLGVVMGLPAALAAARLVMDQLFRVPVADPWTMVAAMGFLMMVAGAAAYLPARRAARVDPTLALRAE